MYFHKDPDDQSVAISVLNTTPSKMTEDSWHTPSNPTQAQLIPCLWVMWTSQKEQTQGRTL